MENFEDRREISNLLNLKVKDVNLRKKSFVLFEFQKQILLGKDCTSFLMKIVRDCKSESARFGT